MQDYVQDHKLNLLRRQEFLGIALADGEEAERRMHEAVCRAGDRSTFSADLAEAIIDWPSEYHLSRRRHCLLRPLAIRAGDKVLELGCGGGAITRFLGELGAEVIAVEASLPRASIASERCRDLPNVKIVLDEVFDFQTSERFDWVLLVGVLQYATVFLDVADPVNHCLATAARFLNPGGKLVVAVNNKLGLKYFNGCGEDHVGVPFYGIQGLYGRHTPQTFGRHELEAHLTSIGLDHKDFYYPFPDYKMPRVIISHRALSEPSFDPADLLASCHARDCTGSPYRHFDDALVFAQAACNGVLGDLSNSFLVAASAQPTVQQPDVELAATYAVDRVPEFVTQTRFIHTSEGVHVIKEALQPRLPRRKTLKNGTVLENLVGRYDYVRGRLLLWRILKAQAESGSLRLVVDTLKPWFEFILRHATYRSEASAKQNISRKNLRDYVLPGTCLDLTPFNLIESDEGLVPIDMEWKVDQEISLGWATIRSITSSLQIGVPFLQNPIRTLADVARALCSAQGLELCEDDIDEWLKLEFGLQTVVSVPRPTSDGLLSFRGALAARDDRIAALDKLLIDRQEAVLERDGRVADLTDAISERGAQLEQSREALADRDRTISERDAQIARSTATVAAIYASSSWRITAPSRSIGELVRRMRRRLRGRAERLLRERAERLLREQAERRLIASSSVFDRSWYLKCNPDVKSTGIDPAFHYLRYGAREGRDPSPYFDSDWYLQQNPDVRKAGINPLVHYLNHGAAEGRYPRPSARVI